MNIANDITDLIGGTPILRLNKLPEHGSAQVLTKLEWYNIGGSVKDRMAKYLIEYAELAGRLEVGKAILEATSGNTGIALAMMAAVRGYKMVIVMPESVSVERRKLIKAYGAELILSPGSQGTAGAIELKEQLMKEFPDKYIGIDQFRDPANIMAHFYTTAEELIKQTDGKMDSVVVGVGTAGTGVGVSLRLKKHNQGIRIVGVIPRVGYSIQGLRSPDEPHPTHLFRSDRFDKLVELSKADEPAIFEIARRAAREEGLLMGISAAAILLVALKEARELGPGKTVVAVLPDSGMKYLSTPLFEE